MKPGGIAILALVTGVSWGCTLPPGPCEDDRLSPSIASNSGAVATTTATGMSIDFGTVALDDSSFVSFSFYEGCRNVQLLSVELSGSADFSLELEGLDGGNGEYPYGEYESDLIYFKPTALGPAAGQITFTTTSRRQPIVTFSLSGTAIAPGPSCTTDDDCVNAFCDGHYCVPGSCGAFDNLPAAAGAPACAPESHACPGKAGLALVDTLSDPNNCGACGHVCGHGCSGGQCGTCPGYRIGPEQDFPLVVAGIPAADVWALELGDFDGDGHPDLLLGADVGGAAGGWLLLNDGTGGFGLAPRRTSVCGSPLRVADFNGDCALDVVAAGQVMLNDGHGNFPARNSVAIANGSPAPLGFAVADLNGDGNADLAGADQVLLGDGRAGFAASSAFQPPGFTALACGDFNGDGRPDLEGYEARFSGGSLFCYLNDGGADLVLGNSYLSVPAGDDGSVPASFLTAASLVAGSDAIVYGEATRVVALPGPAAGTHGALFLGLDAGFHALTVADLDLDGRVDILASEASGTIFTANEALEVDAGFLDLWTGFSLDADGGLSAGRLQIAATNFPVGLVQVADVNGDGIPDVIAATPLFVTATSSVPAPAQIMVFLGSCP